MSRTHPARAPAPAASYPVRTSEAAVTARRATGDDVAELARLLTAFNAEYDAEVAPLQVLEDRFRTMLGRPDFMALLAGTPAVGFATVSLRPSTYHEGGVALLEDLYVTPERRNEGIGAALIGRLVAIAREGGWGRLEIQVDEPDVDAMRFYARHGFTMRDQTTGDRALLWWRELKPGIPRPTERRDLRTNSAVNSGHAHPSMARADRN